MRRIIDHFLLKWKQDTERRSLLIRGARQVGKTYSIRKLGETFPSFVEINLESMPEAARVFEPDLDPVRICQALTFITKKPIIPGQTLLFLDEVQAVPIAITALRYFYEQLPALHVVAAGSLLDFAIEQVGVPVGRVQFLYMYPMSFIEYLAAGGWQLVIDEIINHAPDKELSPVVHDQLLTLLCEYLALGGMPNSVQHWISKKDPLGCADVFSMILQSYRQDFAKYARKSQVKYVELVFDSIPLQLGRKFKYSLIEGDYRKRELAPALDLLVTAGVAHKVYYSAGQGVPLGGQIDLQDYKIVFLDVGLAQAVLDLDIAQWFLSPQGELVNKGSLVEAFVGQELLAYADSRIKNNIYYWHKEGASGHAEIDYLMQIGPTVIPVEVKAGLGRTLKSLQIFLDNHPKSPYGIRFSVQNYSVYNKVNSYPLYAIAKVLSEKNQEVKQAITRLL